ncbi:MAG: Fur family transcriptional regulator [Confluentimicrobium sp.]|nr:Fur family transcriptional regulator [Actibacterium sp.]|tara:strand:- start:772 stop:1308 length:537 start_codon:yes stop_codon:yes gene_type:complete
MPPAHPVDPPVGLPLGFSDHDHGACRRAALDRAAARCAEARLQLTPVRRRVLEILLEAHAAQGAYDVLERLSAEGMGSQPPVAYRALKFLTDHGFAHRIERLNAYVACAHPDAAHEPGFMICRTCKLVAEAPIEPARGALGRSAAETGFTIEKTVMEVEGLCPACRDPHSDPDAGPAC